MRGHLVLLGFVLAIGGRIADAQEPPADPLDGKTFRSVEKLPGGDRPDGKVPLIHWTVRFKDRSFAWLHYDKISIGAYSFDARTGTVTVKGGPNASFDAKTGVLTWRERRYMPTMDAKKVQLVSAPALRDAEADDSPQDSVEEALRGFLSALAKEGQAKEGIEQAYALVAPTTKEKGDPITGVKLDYDSFAREVKAQPAEKFGAYKLGKRRREKEDCVRIFVHFEGGDTDETMLVREGKRWYVADPIHIIR